MRRLLKLPCTLLLMACAACANAQTAAYPVKPIRIICLNQGSAEGAVKRNPVETANCSRMIKAANIRVD